MQDDLTIGDVEIIQMEVNEMSLFERSKRKPRLTTIFICLLLCQSSFSVFGQFVKQVDQEGHVSYSEDPSYDYSADEPSRENQRLNEEHLRYLKEFDRYPAAPAKSKRSPPKITIRSGRAVCVKGLSASNLKLGCN